MKSRNGLIFFSLVAALSIYLLFNSFNFRNTSAQETNKVTRDSVLTNKTGLNQPALMGETGLPVAKPAPDSLLETEVAAARNQLVTGSDEHKLHAIEKIEYILRAGARAEIRAVLRGDLATTVNVASERNIARAALFAFTRSSRSEENRDVIDLLDNASAKHIITNDDYYGEISHQFAAFLNREMMTKLMQSENSYASIVLNNYLINSDLAEKLNESGLITQEFLSHVLNSKPVFSGAPFNLSALEVVQFEEWASGYSNIYGAKYNIENVGVLAQMFNQKVDPRELMAILAGRNGAAVYTMIASSPGGWSNPGLLSVNRFLSEYSDIPSVQLMAQQIALSTGR